MQRLTRMAAGLCLPGLLSLAVPARAVEPLARQLDLVVPFAAGGLADVLARLLAEKLRDAGVAGTAIVENRTGAGGNIGADYVFRAKPDGATLMVSSPGPIAINQGLYADMPFDPAKWVPVAIVASVPNALIVSPALPVRDAAQFVAYAKAHPGGLAYASQGNGTTSHLTAKLFESLTGAQMIHVPYKGDAPALADLAGSQVQLFFGSVGAAMALHKTGKVRILAVADAVRSPALPDVPAFPEIGLPGMQSVTWYALVAPPGTPQAVVRRLNEEVVRAVSQPDVQRRLAGLGLQAGTFDAARTQAFVRDETVRWQKVIKDAKVSLD